MKYRKEDVDNRRLDFVFMMMVSVILAFVIVAGCPAYIIATEAIGVAFFFLATFIAPSSTTRAIVEKKHGKALTAQRKGIA